MVGRTGLIRIELTADDRIALEGLANAAARVEQKILPVAARAAANVQAKLARTKAKQAFRDRTGLLRKSIRVFTGIKVKGAVTMLVSAKKNVVGTYRGKTVRPVKYLHLVELGHEIAIGPTGRSQRGFVLQHKVRGVFYGTPGTSGGFVVARPFLSVAYRLSESAAQNAFTQKVREEFAKIPPWQKNVASFTPAAQAAAKGK